VRFACVRASSHRCLRRRLPPMSRRIVKQLGFHFLLVVSLSSHPHIRHPFPFPLPPSSHTDADIVNGLLERGATRKSAQTLSFFWSGGKFRRTRIPIRMLFLAYRRFSRRPTVVIFFSVATRRDLAVGLWGGEVGVLASRRFRLTPAMNDSGYVNVSTSRN